jgi:tRNA dimethylallyltransferase
MLPALVGPTASGKSEAALVLAERLHAEIVSVDSMLVYRGMDIGTAKPSLEDRSRIPHHMIDVADPSERFTVSRYRDEARRAISAIARPLLVGGSGLYYRAVVDDLSFPPEDPCVRGELEREASVVGPGRLHGRLRELDPVAAARIDPANVRRTIRALEVAAITGEAFSSYSTAWERYEPGRVRAVGIEIPTALLAARIERRVHAMVGAGFADEVRSLVDEGLGGWLTASQAIGYAEFVRHLRGDGSLEDAVTGTIARTKQLARRQMAWFRRDPRIRWLPGDETGCAGIVDEIERCLRSG